VNLIHKVIEPEKLILAWQPSEETGVRQRFAVGEIIKIGEIYKFRYLVDSEDYAKAENYGFSYYPAFRKTDKEYTEGVLDSFLRRIPSRKRGDFSNYLQQWCIDPTAQFSDFALLGHTGAKLPTDAFSLVNPFSNVNAPCEFYIEVAGFLYQGVSLDSLKLNMPVFFVPEPENLVDKNAVKIEANGKIIGYVNRFQCEAFNRWLHNHSVSACIERINRTSSRPFIYIFGRVS
jgi:hypothetical protein